MNFLKVSLLVSSVCSGGYQAGHVPELPMGKDIVNVSTNTGFLDALKNARPGQSIVLANGDYKFTKTIYVSVDGATIRGATHDPSKVIIRGRGFGHGDRNEELIKIMSKNITIANLTIRDVRGNGLKIQTGENHNLLVHNVQFRNICERSIKAPGGDLKPSLNGIVRYCVFEQETPITRDIPGLYGNGDYIAGMDMMKIHGWRIHDNLFLNIQGINGAGRAAVFLWIECRDVIVENNTFINCDRSIAFGNFTKVQSKTNVVNGICRNNFIYSSRYDSGIEIVGVDSVYVINNTVYKKDISTKGRGIRFIANYNNIVFKNNLLRGRLLIEKGAYEIDSTANVIGNLDGYFVHPESGNLHLTGKALLAIDKGVSINQRTSDWDGEKRNGNVDIGADEYYPARFGRKSSHSGCTLKIM